MKKLKHLKLSDSLLIGYPKVSDKNFVNKLSNDFGYFHIYENILNSMNKKYMVFEKSEVIKEEIVDDIILKLIEKKIKKSDIQIELYTYKDNKKIDSILFYSYQWDKDFKDEQRFELISYIDNNFNLWYLETFTNHSEDAVGIKKWDKYKIDTKTGKIKFIEDLYFSVE